LRAALVFDLAVAIDYLHCCHGLTDMSNTPLFSLTGCVDTTLREAMKPAVWDLIDLSQKS